MSVQRKMFQSMTLAMILGVLAFSAPQASEAAWLWVVEGVYKVIKSDKKNDRREHHQSYSGEYRYEDSYNPYHNHPDGLRPDREPHAYNENPLSNQRW